MLAPSPRRATCPARFPAPQLPRIATLVLITWAAFLSIQPDNELLADAPNIVLILADDLGWRDVGFQGSTYYETPNLDRLAREGMVFTSAYANAGNCAPTRACLMSGQYTPRHGVYTVGTSARGSSAQRKLIPTPNREDLDTEIITLAEALQAAGYVSAHIGKWHLGRDPRKQGFDINIAGSHYGSPPGGYFSPYKNPKLPNGPKGEFLTDRLTDEALRFLDEHHERPFFLYLPHYAVHSPIQAKEELIAKYREKEASDGQNDPVYAAMVESLDQSVGRILAKLDQLKLRENTLVIFTSDNGGFGRVTTMHPLRGVKGMLYEGGVRVPCVVSWPGKIAPGSRCDEPIISLDFYPTLLEAAAAATPDQPLDGRSLMPLLTGSGGFEREAIFWHFPAYLQAYHRSEDPFRIRPSGAVRQGDWKLIEHFEDGRLELYNLADDLGEQHNLAQAEPERAEQLLSLLKKWRAELKAPVPTEKNPAYKPKQANAASPPKAP